MQFGSASSAAAAITAFLLVCADGYAISVRLQQLTAPPLSGFKLTGALLLQAAIVVGACAYVAWLQGRPKLDLPPYGSLEAWRSRLLPIFFLALLGAFSAALFYDGVVCGDKPIAIVRGVGACS